jgi:coenzyme PQQ biosynthesis protein PqqD
LQFDEKSARHVLLVPERGFFLNPTASAVAVLCTGELSVAVIVERLVESYGKISQEQVEREVLSFLQQLIERGLLEIQS